MRQIVRSRRISRPSGVVWDQLADFGAISGWAHDVDHSCLLDPVDDDRIGPGVVRRIQTGRTTVLERIVTWHPPDELAYDIEGLPGLVRSARNTWTLAADGQDHTLVTLTTRLDCGSRPPQRLAARVVGRALARVSNGLLDSLERAHASSATESTTSRSATPPATRSTTPPAAPSTARAATSRKGSA